MRARTGGPFYFPAIMTCILTILITASAYPSRAVSEPEKQPRQIAAKVNGNAIYVDQLDSLIEKEIKTFKKYGARTIPPHMMDRLRKKALNKAIEQELLRQESEKVTVPDLDRKVDEKLKELKGKYPSDEHFRERMSANSRTEGDLRESLAKTIYIDEYMKQKGLTNIEIPEEDIRAYYESNPRAFQREEMVKVSHILILVEKDAGKDKKARALDKAEKIRDEIIKGKDFGESAKEHSQDGYALQGGDMGYIKRGFMPPEFDKAAFALEKGHVSEVVETRHGYHIIKLADKKPAGKVPYTEMRNFIEKYLRERIEKDKFEAHMAELKKNAKIEFLLKEVGQSKNSS
jgi:peptidyl-prolyl cis-trans isomerase C